MGVMNRETVGYIECKDCGERGSLHLTKRGKGSFLYKRCGCGCDQRTGVKIQEKWRREMEPLPGFEDLKIEPPEPDGVKGPEPSKEPEKNQEQEPNEPKATGAPWIIAGIVGAVVFVAKIAKGAA